MKKKITKKTKVRMSKLIAIMMSLAMLLQTVAFADDVIPNSIAEVDTPLSNEEIDKETEEIELSDLAIVSEDESKRGETEKHFLCEDGSFVAVSYGSPVHYQDEDGNWQEIDNTLIETQNENGKTVYTNRSGGKGFVPEVSFANNTDGKFATMKSGDYSVSWRISAKKDVLLLQEYNQSKTPVVLQGPISTGKNETDSANDNVLQDEKFELSLAKPIFTTAEDFTKYSDSERKIFAEKAASKLVYNEAFGDKTKVEYIVAYDRVKENIILETESDITTYITSVTAENMKATLNEDNTVVFTSCEDGSTIFEIPPMYMYDSVEEYSEDIEVTVKQTGKWDYDIIIEPSLQWLKDENRVYPITIDPTFTQNVVNYSSNTYDTYVVEGSTEYHNNESKLYAGVKDGKVHRIYTKLKTLPAIPSYATINSAVYRLELSSGTSTANNAFSCYSLATAMTSGQINWNTAPAASACIRSSVMPTLSNGNYYLSFDLTNSLIAVYNGYAYNGLMIRYTNENPSPADYNSMYSSDADSLMPVLYIEYSTTGTDADIDTGIYYIKNPGRNLYLDVDHGYTADQTAVLGYDFNGANNQRWRITNLNNGYYTIVPMHNQGSALMYYGDSNNSLVMTYNGIVNSTTYTDYAQWSIQSNDDGTVRIVAKRSSGSYPRVLDLPGGSGTQVQIYDWTGSGNGNQKWELEESGPDFSGYAVYRDGVVGNIEWHAALMCDVNYLCDTPIIHIGGPGKTVDESSWDDFLANNDYQGVYKPNGIISDEKRAAVVATARLLASRGDISYTVIQQLTYDEDALGTGTKIQPSHIIKMRCDGVVEYCYEYNGIKIYGDSNNWDITDPENVADHSGIDITPKKQAQNYMTLISVDEPI